MSGPPPTGGRPPGDAWSYGFGAMAPSPYTGYSGVPSLSLGQIADAIYALPQEQREGLFRLLNVAPIGTSTVGPQGPVAGPGPSTQSSRQEAARAGGISDDGRTSTDPKTGKVFKVTPAKPRSPEYIALDKGVKDALARLKALPITSGIASSPESKEIREAAVRQLEGAKTALKSYKTAHPDEFQGPPTKRGGSGPSGR